MKLWVDGEFLGFFDSADSAAERLNEWRRANKEKILYLFECGGEQYSFADFWESFLEANAGRDVEVRVMASTKESLQLELVDSVLEYISRLCSSIEDLAEHFYAGPDRTAWKQLSDFIEGLSFLNLSREFIKCPAFVQGEFEEKLKVFLEAVETGDAVALADALIYEWNPWLEMIKNEISKQN